MLSKFKISFTQATEVGFIDPETMKRQWYVCYYGRGTSMEVADILSGNTQHIFAICTDGEIVFMDTMVVRIETL